MRNLRNADRFDNHREMTARRDSAADCREGHRIKRGDRIGWHKGLGKATCADCWRAWCAENADADEMERVTAEQQGYSIGGWYND